LKKAVVRLTGLADRGPAGFGVQETMADVQAGGDVVTAPCGADGEIAIAASPIQNALVTHFADQAEDQFALQAFSDRSDLR
jgi:hypothetical protein